MDFMYVFLIKENTPNELYAGAKIGPQWVITYVYV